MGTAVARFALAAAAAFALAACGGGGSGGQAQSLADSATKAAYNDDISALTQNFDDQLKTQVNRAQVGTLSDQMHELGDYKGLTFVSSDPAKNEFTYRADFTKGNANVVVRLDSDGKASAYHVFVPVASTQ